PRPAGATPGSAGPGSSAARRTRDPGPASLPVRRRTRAAGSSVGPAGHHPSVDPLALVDLLALADTVGRRRLGLGGLLLRDGLLRGRDPRRRGERTGGELVRGGPAVGAARVLVMRGRLCR